MRSLLLLVPVVAAATMVRTDFEGGSLGRVEKISDTHLRLGLAGEKDQDGRNRQATWYYFRIENAPAERITIDMVDLPGEYNYKPNRGAITADTPPVISYDQKTWTHLETFEYDPEEPRLRLFIKPEQSEFWVAHVAPYTTEHLAALREDIRARPGFREQILGKTPEGRDMLLWTIHQGTGAGRKTVWLMFRQHSWESGSSWVGEGALRALLAATPEAAKLRSDIVWKIFPMCDPDGVARGGVRFNAKGYDLNRNWDIVDPKNMPEIAMQRNAVRDWLKAGNSIDIFLTLHNTETAEYLLGPTDPKGKHGALGDRLFRLLTEETTFAPSRPLSFAGPTTTPGKPGRMTVVQGLARDFGIAAFLMEQRVAFNKKLGRLPGIPDRLQFGAELVQALHKAAVLP